jgi:hypothetical protein
MSKKSSMSVAQTRFLSLPVTSPFRIELIAGSIVDVVSTGYERKGGGRG